MRYLLFFIVVSCFFSCKDQEVMIFEGENAVSFYEYYVITNPRTYSFGNTDNEDKVTDSVFVEMQITGKLADYARKIKLKTVAGTTARLGIDYDFPEEITLPAGAYKTKYPIYLYKTPQMMLDTMILIVEPAETVDFKVGAVGTIPGKSSMRAEDKLFKQLTYYIHDMLEMPSGWSSPTFGVFSSVKYRFMIKTIPEADETSWTVATGSTRLPILRAALTAYELTNGPLMDESNNRVTF